MAPAVTLFEYHYDQTPVSVADIADEVQSMRNQIRLAELYGRSVCWVLLP